MALDLIAYEQRAREAVKYFWDSRERSGVTGGGNMNGFADLVVNVVKANGLAHAEIHEARKVLTLPGYFRPTKLWDLLVIHKGELIVAVELKSQAGPSFSNNFNNRTEEAKKRSAPGMTCGPLSAKAPLANSPGHSSAG